MQKRHGVVCPKALQAERLRKHLGHVYAPKCRALPTEPHPDFIQFYLKIFRKWSTMWSSGILTENLEKQKRHGAVCPKALCAERLCKRLGCIYAPKLRALPAAPHPAKLFLYYIIHKFQPSVNICGKNFHKFDKMFYSLSIVLVNQNCNSPSQNNQAKRFCQGVSPPLEE